VRIAERKACNSDAAPATVNEVVGLHPPLCADTGRRRLGFHPLVSPETGLVPSRSTSRGAWGIGALPSP